MSTNSIQISPTGRRELVARGTSAGKSNRAIARELGVNEVTVRRDRQFLATPTYQHPVKMPRAKKPLRAPNPALLRRRRWKKIIDVAQSWMREQTGSLANVNYILDKAGRILYESRSAQANFPPSEADPADLFVQMRPRRVEDEMMGLDFRALWFARWLGVCLPAQEREQDEVLRQTSKWAMAEAARGGFVY
jgi:hypothetical protein